MKFLVLVVACLLGISFSAHAAGGCYSADEVEAEQGLRIHSELMVIGLNCQQMVHDKGNLYVQYREFTRRNKSLLSGYERTLINFYRAQGAANPEGKLHDLRTMLANGVSTQAARMQPNVFCRNYASRIAQANQMDQATVRRWAQSNYSSAQTTRAACAKTASR